MLTSCSVHLPSHTPLVPRRPIYILRFYLAISGCIMWNGRMNSGALVDSMWKGAAIDYLRYSSLYSETVFRPFGRSHEHGRMQLVERRA